MGQNVTFRHKYGILGTPRSFIKNGLRDFCLLNPDFMQKLTKCCYRQTDGQIWIHRTLRQNQRFFDVFREYKKRPVAWNEFKHYGYLTYLKRLYRKWIMSEICSEFYCLTLPVRFLGEEKKIKLNFYFHTSCGASKDFLKALTASIKPFEAP